MKKIILGFLLLSFGLTSIGQIDSLKIGIEAVGAVGSNGILPLHVGHNKYGKLNPNSNDGYLEPSFYLPFNIIGDLSIEFGANYVIKPKLENSFFHQAFANLKYNAIEFRAGKNAINNDWYNDRLGSGNLFQSINARTITRIEGGIYQYTPIPFFKYLEVKGMVSVGWLEEDRVVKDAMYHEKFAYIKTAQLPINIFFGLNHNVLYGGVTPSGRELPSNFWEAFFARSATNSGNASDSINAAGAHFGVFDLGFEIPLEKSLLKISFQQPISDKSGYSSNFTHNKDFVLYLELEFDEHPWIRSIVYEGINTHHQSGEGTPDPVVNGQFYTIGSLLAQEDWDQFLFDEYGIETENVSKEEYLRTIQVESNFGYGWSGRDDHYNNGQYPLGNSFYRMNIGNPLFTNRDRFDAQVDTDLSDRLFIINNRIVGHHLGFGAYYKNWDFDLLATITYNYGTYAGKYSGSRFSWNLDKDYYFLNVVGMQYVGFNARGKYKKLDFIGSIGLDTGDFGNTFGMSAGLLYKLK